MRLLFAAAALSCLVWAPAVSAQSVLSGEIGGSVTDASGQPLPNVLVTLGSPETGLARDATSTLDGSFSFDLVPPGRYTVRAEIIGYRPVLVTGVAVAAGGFRSVEFVVQPASPPVTRVDTVRLQGGDGRWTAHGPTTLPDELGAFQDLSGSLSALGRLSPDVDGQGGALGLPGAATPYVVDGVPFFRAAHPGRRGDDLASPAFPTAFLSSTGLSRRPTAVEHLLMAGATVDAETRSGPRGGGDLDVEGAWSGAPLWSSGIVDVPSPELMSYRAFGEGAVDLVPESTRLYLAGEAASYEAPLQARLPSDAADQLIGFDDPIQDLLLLPSVEGVSRYSGLARLDRWGPTSRLTVRASGGYAERSYSQAPPGLLEYGVPLPEESTEISTSLGYSSQLTERYIFEALGGVSWSRRVFAGTQPQVWAPAFLTDTGLPIGPAPHSGAYSSRLDAFASTSIRFPLAGGDVRAGLSAQAARHSLNYIASTSADLAFSDLAAAERGEGVHRSATTDQSFFTVPRIGAFAQYTWRPNPDVQVLIGGRFDYTTLPTDEFRLNEEWLSVTGTRNDDVPTAFSLPAGHFSVTWDLSGDGTTVFAGGGAIAHGSLDPAVLHETYSRDGAVTARRALGSGPRWPSPGVPSGARQEEVLSLLGPDTRPPRTVTLEGSLAQSLGAGWTVHVSGTARNTDFIARRRDLNLPSFALASDQWERPVLGNLEKVGSVVAAVPGSNRRFGGFDAVWAIDPDGWSRYWGATLGLGYSSEATDFFLAYTRSETQDNWLGAREGVPDAELAPGLTGQDEPEWSEGISDFDIPDRLVAAARTRVELGGTEAEFSAVYRWRSGTPFTPGYRVGVDANGDGSFRNDVAYVPGRSELGELLDSWSCLADQVGDFAERNSCRGPERATLDASVRLGIAEVGGRRLWLTVEGFNLIEDEGGIVDDALLLVDPGADLIRSEGDRRVDLPLTVNPNFGEVVLPATRGRMLRVGVRVGG